jgi:sucrose-6-phosphate hydrolase SacC (GH32 family)
VADGRARRVSSDGPFYDPVHKLYHLFYQIHIALDMDGAGDGPDWGHWVSKDFTKWAQLPVAIWNDQYYDNSAIFTGSTTIVDGKPVMMYPGKCNCKGTNVTGAPCCNDGKGGFTYVLVVPEDPGDKLYTNWSKTGSIGGKTFTNPVVNNTGDDPSTAWKLNGDESAEWRIIGNQACKPEGGNPVYGSKDFVSWYKVGCSTLMAGDCPTFFPLPKLFPGTEHYLDAHGPLPNHVHKSGGRGGDQFQVGTWTDGKPGSESEGGTPGTWEVLAGTGTVFQDKGTTHASKDFFDPVQSRRILWVWGTVPSGIQTVPRELTYHPGLKRIVWNPTAEVAALRSATPIAKLPATPIPAGGTPVSLKAAKASDIELYFEVPKQAATLAVQIGSSGSCFIDFVPGANQMAKCGFNATKGHKGGEDAVPLLGDETYLSMRVLIDGSVGECYWQEGRVAMTVELTAEDQETVLISSSGADGALLNGTSWQMNDVHTTVDDVLA